MSLSDNSSDIPIIDPSRCPLCGAPNQCALAADPSASECWCDNQEFPPELLAKIPEKSVRRACVCWNCLEQYRESIGNLDGTS